MPLLVAHVRDGGSVICLPLAVGLATADAALPEVAGIPRLRAVRRDQGAAERVRQLSQFLRMPTDGPPPHGRGTSKVENEAVARRGSQIPSFELPAATDGPNGVITRGQRNAISADVLARNRFAGLGVSLRESAVPVEHPQCPVRELKVYGVSLGSKYADSASVTA